MLVQNAGEDRRSPGDVCISWSGIGTSTKRIELIGWTLADLAREAVDRGEMEEAEVVLGIAASGLPIAFVVAEELEKPFAVLRPYPLKQKASMASKQYESGSISVSFSGVKRRKVLIVDDIIGTGDTIRSAVEALRKEEADPVGAVVLIDKLSAERVDGIPVTSLIKVMRTADP